MRLLTSVAFPHCCLLHRDHAHLRHQQTVAALLPVCCRALVRLVVWRRSGSRLLLHGGCGNLEQQAVQFGGPTVVQVLMVLTVLAAAGAGWW